MSDVVDAEVVEDSQELVPADPPQMNALFRTDDPVEVVEQATKVANALADVIQSKKLFAKIQGKSHVMVEGWQLLGSMLGVTAVCVGTEQVDGGFKATVEARAADGRVVGRADAVCTKHERRGPWKNADDYARLSMAQTRATSKALKGPLGFVVSLAGYATTPAEEMTFAEPDAAPAESPPEATGPDRISSVDADALVKVVKASGLPIGDVKAKLQELGVEGKLTSLRQGLGLLTKAQAELFYVWAVQPQSDVPADTKGMA